MEEKFNEPKLVLSRIYTRGGDQGMTSLVNGRRVSKDDPRIETYGAVDELNSVLGLAVVSIEEQLDAHPRLEPLRQTLVRVQHELFNLGSELATDPGQLYPNQARITSAETDALESEMDRLNEELPPLRSFVLPGGSRLNGELHLARTICRRAERRLISLSHAEEVPPDAVRYLNRLSDALFVWSRWANMVAGAAECLWQPNLAASQSGG